MRRSNSKNGFTLIEIVLVLALAGMLLIIVFLAVSGAQKARRDSQRKNDLAMFFAKIEEYRSNNNNQHPANQADLDNFKNTYLASKTDPLEGTQYTFTYWELTHDRRPVPGEIIYGREHLCYVNGNDIIADQIGTYKTDFDNDHYMMIYQEQGGYYCLDNNPDKH